MSKGIPSKRYTAAFKKHVIETMRKEGMSYTETARQFEINGHHTIQAWERIYLAEGPEGFTAERCGHRSKGSPAKLDKQVEKDIIAENQRLRAENAYLKNLQALVLECERSQRKKHW